MAWNKTCMLSLRNRAGCHKDFVASYFSPQLGWVFVKRSNQLGCLLHQLGGTLSLSKRCMGRDACAPVASYCSWAGFYNEDKAHGLCFDFDDASLQMK